MPKNCEVVEMRNSADVVGYSCSRTANAECSDCGTELCESQKNMRHLSQRILSFLLILPFGAALQSCVSRSRASSGTKQSLKLPYCGFVNLGLFPVREGHKLIQNFLQSLEPPFVVGGCPSISPVHMRAVRFTNLGYFFPKFLDAL